MHILEGGAVTCAGATSSNGALCVKGGLWGHRRRKAQLHGAKKKARPTRTCAWGSALSRAARARPHPLHAFAARAPLRTQSARARMSESERAQRKNEDPQAKHLWSMGALAGGATVRARPASRVKACCARRCGELSARVEYARAHARADTHDGKLAVSCW